MILSRIDPFASWSDDGDSWYVEYVKVMDLDTNRGWKARFNRWISESK